ncbi:hypothetical protein PR202_gb22699 [Eleusine coracana subsp. coracana]|uniref:Uncharacterized protein n=1 Tax=Eleusine coracana subsp. coracana TaxID=191504 RepID=A0AAV5FGZ6_ELECO|nr:hypothetical protein PR202_gb22699 [Eleusine coracana subsp. coracana]
MDAQRQLRRRWLRALTEAVATGAHSDVAAEGADGGGGHPEQAARGAGAGHCRRREARGRERLRRRRGVPGETGRRCFCCGDFAGEHSIVADIEVVGLDYVNAAMERLERNDVRYRFVADVAGSLSLGVAASA